MDLKSNGTIAEKLKPTFENVTREFITETMYEILFDDIVPNFRFEFREEEAINFIEKVLVDYANKYDYYKKKLPKLLGKIKEKTNGNKAEPVMIINDYKQFFELLRQFYEKVIELYFLRTKMSGFPVYEKNNCFKYIWLRATPEDFNNVEEFLRKQVEMINDKTFQKYDEETCFGNVKFLDDNIICIKNGIARTWDENFREIEIRIYDKNTYHKKNFLDRQYYELPVIRYGIYEKHGKKVCCIGSIQNKSDDYEENKLKKKINRKKYQVNNGVPEEEKFKVEPKNILALSIFINLLHQEGITDIEAPSIYVLDYEYHKGRSKEMLINFQEEWTKNRIKKYPEQYNKNKYYFERGYQKEELITELKSERFILTFMRLLYHYSNGNIKSYPGDVDSCLHMNIPITKGEYDIKGDVLQELYTIIKQKYLENER